MTNRTRVKSWLLGHFCAGVLLAFSVELAVREWCAGDTIFPWWLSAGFAVYAVVYAVYYPRRLQLDRLEG